MPTGNPASEREGMQTYDPKGGECVGGTGGGFGCSFEQRQSFHRTWRGRRATAACVQELRVGEASRNSFPVPFLSEIRHLEMGAYPLPIKMSTSLLRLGSPASQLGIKRMGARAPTESESRATRIHRVLGVGTEGVPWLIRASTPAGRSPRYRVSKSRHSLDF